jgi:hypothetical protein
MLYNKNAFQQFSLMRRIQAHGTKPDDDRRSRGNTRGNCLSGYASPRALSNAAAAWRNL